MLEPYFLYTSLKEADFSRLNLFVLSAARHAGVGAKLDGERHEQTVTSVTDFIFCRRSLAPSIVTYKNVTVTYWRDDNDLGVLDKFKTKFLDRLLHDEWHNALYWFKQGQ